MVRPKTGQGVALLRQDTVREWPCHHAAHRIATSTVHYSGEWTVMHVLGDPSQGPAGAPAPWCPSRSDLEDVTSPNAMKPSAP